MKVGIFYNSISNPNKFSNKVALMDNFKQGVLANGDQVVEYRSNTLPAESLDAGFILGYTLEQNFRRRIIDTLTEQGTPRVFVDSNILHYARGEHEWHRYSLNSVYPNDGVYFFNDLDRTKWDVYSQWHGVTMRPWREPDRKNYQHILVLCQRPHGWNMFGNNQEEWLDNLVENIRSIEPKRKIVFRMHPGDGTRMQQIERLRTKYGKQANFSEGENIRDALADAWCTVGYNSTPNVVAAIKGVPCYLQDPTHSWAADVGFNDLLKILEPPMPDRSEWIHKIANIHWSNEEVRSGKLWAAIRQYISAAR
jgi:hypothetical protein